MTNEEVAAMPQGTKVRFLGFRDTASQEMIGVEVGSEMTRDRCRSDGPGWRDEELFAFRHGPGSQDYDFFFPEEVELV